LRVSDVIFFDRIVVHFGNGTSRELAVSERISPEGRNYVIDLPGERRPLESVELWYYKEPWGHNPSVSLYGIPLGYIDGKIPTKSIRFGQTEIIRKQAPANWHIPPARPTLPACRPNRSPPPVHGRPGTRGIILITPP
jgi:hypothetical protein